MTQFLRPDSNVTQTLFTGGFAQIDESSASDADFAYSDTSGSPILEVGLSNPLGFPAAGTTTVRFRIAECTPGVAPDPGFGDPTVIVHVYQGGTLIASDIAQEGTDAWVTHTFTPDMSAVTDWDDLRLRFTVTPDGVGGSARGIAISWAEIEAQDPGGGMIAFFL